MQLARTSKIAAGGKARSDGRASIMWTSFLPWSHSAMHLHYCRFTHTHTHTHTHTKLSEIKLGEGESLDYHDNLANDALCGTIILSGDCLVSSRDVVDHRASSLRKHHGRRKQDVVGRLPDVELRQSDVRLPIRRRSGLLPGARFQLDLQRRRQSVPEALLARRHHRGGRKHRS